MKLVDMKNKGLEYPIFNGSKCAIPAGTKHVKIGFHQSHLVRNTRNGKIYSKWFTVPLSRNEIRLNVYVHNGQTIHA